MSEPISAQEVNRQLRGLRAIERVRDVVDDRFELEVRQAVLGNAGGMVGVADLARRR